MILYWNEDRPRFSKDVIFLILALAIHFPLTKMKFSMSTEQKEIPQQRLISVDYMEQPKKLESPLDAPVVKKDIFDKFKDIFSKKQEPPKPKTLAPAAPAAPTPPALLEAQKKLMMKENFTAQAPSALANMKSSSLKTAPMQTPIALPAQKSQNPANALASKGSFQVAQTSLPQAIGKSDLATGQAQGTAIAIPTGQSAKKEALSTPPKFQASRFGANANTAQGGALAPASGLKGLSTGGQIAAPLPVGSGSAPSAPNPQAALASKHFGQGSGQASLPGTGPAKLAGAGAPARAAISSASPFQITGMLQNRKILSKELPSYPAWAQEKGLQGSVTVEFTVAPNGSVQEAMVVRRTSGYPELDKIVMQALKRWKFEAQTNGLNRDEVGTITFIFSLR